MDALRSLYEKLGFQNVKTYLQSGNVIFTGKDADLQAMARKISGQIEKTFGFEVPVIVLTIDALTQAIERNPLLKHKGKDKASFYITFLSSSPGPYDPATIEDKKQDGEEIFFSDRAVYLYCPSGYGKTKLSNSFLETKLKVESTTRNWKTANELLKLAQQTSAKK